MVVVGDVGRRAPTATDRNEPIPRVFLLSWEYTPSTCRDCAMDRERERERETEVFIENLVEFWFRR